MSAPTAPIALPVTGVPVTTASAATLEDSSAAGSRRTVGLLLGVGSALAFSSSGPFVKPLLEAGWSLGAALVLRMGIAAVLLTPWLVRAVLRERRAIVRNWRLIVGLGLTGMAGCQLFYFAALQRMPVAMALLIQYLAPVLLVLLAWARTRRIPSRLVMAGSVVSIAGLVLVVDIAGARFDLLGTLFALCAAMCAGAYFLMLERTPDDLPPLALAASGLWVGALLMGVLIGVGVLPFAAPAVDVVLGGVTIPWWAAIGWIACVATALAYALGVRAIPLLGSRVASFVGLSEALFALAFAWLLLSEQPTIVQGLGGILIIGGVILVRRDRERQESSRARSMRGRMR